MLLKCPACTDRSAVVLGERDGYDVFQCQAKGCRHTWRTLYLGYVRVGARPREGEKYRGNWYHDTMCEAKGIPTFVDRFDHDKSVGESRTRKIRELRPGGGLTLVDVGCGAGAFVLAALESGFNAFGVDLDTALLEWSMDAHERLARRLLSMDRLPTAFDGWDVITWHDVLEHLADPYEKLIQSSRVIAAGGLLVIEAPDPCSREAIDEGIGWRHIKPHEHTMLLSTESWGAMLKASGFKVIETAVPVPGKLAVYAERVL